MKQTILEQRKRAAWIAFSQSPRVTVRANLDVGRDAHAWIFESGFDAGVAAMLAESQEEQRTTAQESNDIGERMLAQAVDYAERMREKDAREDSA